MKRLIISAFVLTLLICPAGPVLAQGAPSSPPMISMPSGSGSHSKDYDVRMKEQKEKEARDKKIDDAIKKAWGEEKPKEPK